MTMPMTSRDHSDRELLRWFLALSIDDQRSPRTLARLRAASWTIATLSSLTGLSIDDVSARLQEVTR